jgi:hypothetical protein
MNLRALYVSKLAKCPLICLADLAGDLRCVGLLIIADFAANCQLANWELPISLLIVCASWHVPLLWSLETRQREVALFTRVVLS